MSSYFPQFMSISASSQPPSPLPRTPTSLQCESYNLSALFHDPVHCSLINSGVHFSSPMTFRCVYKGAGWIWVGTQNYQNISFIFNLHFTHCPLNLTLDAIVHAVTSDERHSPLKDITLSLFVPVYVPLTEVSALIPNMFKSTTSNTKHPSLLFFLNKIITI